MCQLYTLHTHCILCCGYELFYLFKVDFIIIFEWQPLITIMVCFAKKMWNKTEIRQTSNNINKKKCVWSVQHEKFVSMRLNSGKCSTENELRRVFQHKLFSCLLFPTKNSLDNQILNIFQTISIFATIFLFWIQTNLCFVN